MTVLHNTISYETQTFTVGAGGNLTETACVNQNGDNACAGTLEMIWIDTGAGWDATTVITIKDVLGATLWSDTVTGDTTVKRDAIAGAALVGIPQVSASGGTADDTFTLCLKVKQ